MFGGSAMPTLVPTLNAPTLDMPMRTCSILAACLMATTLLAQNVPGGSPQFLFNGTEHDFGWVLQDSKNTHVFTFKNTGNAPLIIESAVGSCGCTVPDYPTAPIAPGGEGEIKVVYSPGKQQDHQEKTVTVVANTVPKQTRLRIHALVLTEAPAVAPEPHVFEPLPPPVEPAFDPEPSTFDPLATEEVPSGPVTWVRFDEMEHDFGTILQGSENPYVFKFKNTGTEPLVIKSANGSCGCTVPFYAKDPIAPGEESEIHVVYKPGKQKGQQQKTVTITANTEPKVTTLRILAEVMEVDSVTETSIFELEEEMKEDRMAIEAVNPGCFVIFPNPASHELRLDLKEHIGQSAQVRITDGTGKEMLQTTIGSINSETSRLDVASFAPGIYIATVQVDGAAPVSQCFMVER